MSTTITKNFTLEELIASDEAKRKGIKNEPTLQAVVNLTHLCANVLQPLRDWYGRPIVIGSGYRSAKLNAAVGGVKNSQHMSGEAVDLFINGNMVIGQLWFEWIRDNLEFDQLIWEHNANGTFWVHVSYTATGKNRHQVINELLKK